MRFLLCALALSFGVSYADITANMLNQTHDGATINAGTYLNTPGSETKFINSAGTGITLNAGSNIRGAEVQNWQLNGNGGAIHIQAPDQVVRLNGNIDVRGFVKTGAVYPGDGGKVTVDAAYLFQNGNIYAGGFGGGDVSFNVGGMTMGSNSRIDATGSIGELMPNGVHQTGAGGSVIINSTGDVNISQGAMIKTNGANGPAFVDPQTGKFFQANNLISVSGHMVNMDGVLLADHLENYQGGVISLTAQGADADVNIGATGIVQGERSIDITAGRDVNQQGLVLSKSYSFAFHDPASSVNGVAGGWGGPITISAGRAINQTGRIQSDGAASSGGWSYPEFSGVWNGGNAGSITLSANSITNNGVIRGTGGSSELGRGGDGANVIFVGATPSGNGSVVTFGGFGDTNGSLGTITAPDPASSTNTLIGIWKKTP